MWQLNVMSYVRAIRAALPHLRESRGAIVNVSSTAGKRPSVGMPHYSVTKAAVLSLSRLVADTYARRRDPLQRGHARADGDRGLARRRRARRPAGRRPRRGAREGRRRPPARPARGAGGDRRRDRVPRLRPRVVRDGRGVERGRRHGPDHHLTRCATSLATIEDVARRSTHNASTANPRGNARAGRKSRRRLRGAHPRARGAGALAARGALVRHARPEPRRGREHDPDAVPARPRPDRPLEAVPPAEGEDAGLHRSGGRPLPHPDHAHAGDDRDRSRRRPRAAAERGSDRGDRARARHGPPAVRPRRRGAARPLPRRAVRHRLPPQRAVAPDRAGAEPDRRGVRRDPHAQRAAGAADRSRARSCGSSIGSRTSTTTSTTRSVGGCWRQTTFRARRSSCSATPARAGSTRSCTT